MAGLAQLRRVGLAGPVVNCAYGYQEKEQEEGKIKPGEAWQKTEKEADSQDASGGQEEACEEGDKEEG